MKRARTGLRARWIHGLPAFLFERESGRYARVLLWVVLAVAIWLSLEASLEWSVVPKGTFVSVLGWLVPGEGWGSPWLLYLTRFLIWTGAALWLAGPAVLRCTAAWMAVAGMLLLGSVYWENLPWFRHKYVPPFWLLLILALREHAEKDPRLAPRWVREGAVFVLATFYGGAGIAKLLESGFPWCDGVALQLWFWQLGDKTSLLRTWVIANAPFAQFLAIGAILLEVGSLLAIPFPRIRAPLGIGLLVMHGCIDRVFHIDFRSNMLLIATILFPWASRNTEEPSTQRDGH